MPSEKQEMLYSRGFKDFIWEYLFLGSRVRIPHSPWHTKKTARLATKVGLSYAQIGRYEFKGVKHKVDILKEIANALDTSVSSKLV